MTTTITGFDAGESRLLADLHSRAFPDFFLSSLGEGFLAEFYRSFVADPDAVAVVARSADGVPVGVAVGSLDPTGFYGRLLRRRVLPFALRATAAVLRTPRAAPRLLRGLTYRGDSPDELPGALLSSICVDPVERGTGIGRVLESSWTRAVADRGATTAHLTTDRDANDAVRAFYRSAGWREYDVHTTPEGRAMCRYTKDLRREPTR